MVTHPAMLGVDERRAMHSSSCSDRTLLMTEVPTCICTHLLPQHLHAKQTFLALPWYLSFALFFSRRYPLSRVVVLPCGCGLIHLSPPVQWCLLVPILCTCWHPRMCRTYLLIFDHRRLLDGRSAQWLLWWLCMLIGAAGTAAAGILLLVLVRPLSLKLPPCVSQMSSH